MLSLCRVFGLFSFASIKFFFLKKTKLFLVVKSPFVYKKTKEQFSKEMRKMHLRFKLFASTLIYQEYLYSTFLSVLLNFFDFKIYKTYLMGTRL